MKYTQYIEKKSDGNPFGLFIFGLVRFNYYCFAKISFNYYVPSNSKSKIFSFDSLFENLFVLVIIGSYILTKSI